MLMFYKLFWCIFTIIYAFEIMSTVSMYMVEILTNDEFLCISSQRHVQ